jgi:hypothetical protein
MHCSMYLISLLLAQMHLFTQREYVSFHFFSSSTARSGSQVCIPSRIQSEYPEAIFLFRSDWTESHRIVSFSALTILYTLHFHHLLQESPVLSYT